MLPEQMLAWGYTRNCIREVMEYGTIRKAEIGAENVYDYSIGNPSIPAPACINETIAELLKMDSVELHGYTTAAGLPSVRDAIARDLNKKFDLGLTGDLFYITCGCASSIAIALRAVLFPGDEVLVMAPFFPEYRVFTEASRGVVRVIPPRSDFQIDLDAVAAALSPKTKAVIINSPNNPSGMVYSDETLRELAKLLKAHEEKIGETVYLLSDEPYRELVYDMPIAPNAMKYYDDTFICYSFSKAMSIPGERIGYLAVSPRMHECSAVYAAVLGAISFLTSRYLAFPGLDRLEHLGAGSMGYPVMVASCIIGFFPYGLLALHERIDLRQAVGAVLGITGILLGCIR